MPPSPCGFRVCPHGSKRPHGTSSKEASAAPQGLLGRFWPPLQRAPPSGLGRVRRRAELHRLHSISIDSEPLVQVAAAVAAPPAPTASIAALTAASAAKRSEAEASTAERATRPSRTSQAAEAAAAGWPLARFPSAYRVLRGTRRRRQHMSPPYDATATSYISPQPEAGVAQNPHLLLLLQWRKCLRLPERN